ncbi:hypothetical protein Pmani_018017 [Petrolisthes manimaculis]|uniref:Uncharacterized protein n=1 Tax=Petrolisthes manimaculis TaxID=1843537 RepID=A0AAE1PNC0_9EUCA|nr:hypothetical protein Pmani_018017 [Petrolisthes manimaculis]
MFPDSCMTSWISGQALAGVLSSLARIASLGVGGEEMDPALSGLIYFLLADAFLLVTIAGYAALRKSIWPMGTTQAVTLCITISVFPAVVVYITSSLPESRWTQVFFQPTITFLLFNFGDFVGREMSRLVKFLSPCEYEMGGGIMVALSGIGVIMGSLVSPALVKLWAPV